MSDPKINNKDDDDNESPRQYRGISFITKTDNKKFHVEKNILTIFFSALCMSIGIGINQLFLSFVNKKSKHEIVITMIYVASLFLITIILAYFLNLSIN